MADDGLIAAYLRELAYSVRALPDADDIVAEAADHLYCAAEASAGTGTAHEAEAAAVARFGSAALIARVNKSESKRGASVPTTRTRQAGLAAMLAPLLVIGGQLLNVNVERGAIHGLGVMMLSAAFPALVYALWGLVHRHGGLGPLGRAGFVLAVVSPALSLAGGYAAVLLLALLLAVAVAAVSVQMLRAGVMPVAAVTLVGAGGAGMVTGMLGALLFRPLGVIALASLAATVAGFVLLGWYLWREPAVDRRRVTPIAA